MGRQYTPEDIREIGTDTIPAVAASYETLKNRTAEADSLVDETFRNKSIIPNPASEAFTTLWDRFVTVTEESPETLNAMGETFATIADSYDADEEDNILDLDSVFDQDLENHYLNELNG
ncbi:hypothetical protein [Glycomyces xiaoerkulensis]|uniref:hypothetical protein n=1 Tax=Glycomyces xiaoerkulensis TaxID=2038139 RepID=UPI0013000C58|nr:hypothetical protein [Glycomyces xiaoerkulensis]